MDMMGGDFVDSLVKTLKSKGGSRLFAIFLAANMTSDLMLLQNDNNDAMWRARSVVELVTLGGSTVLLTKGPMGKVGHILQNAVWYAGWGAIATS
jgi:hypothetical protein